MFKNNFSSICGMILKVQSDRKTHFAVGQDFSDRGKKRFYGRFG